jgi:predicted nucleic acid-binding protein
VIAADTSSLIAFFEGESGADTSLVDEALNAKRLVLPPVVLSEILSDPKLPKDFLKAILQIPLLEIKEGYWVRSGLARAKVLSRGRKARVADALIAQACIDEDVPLITRDKDFRSFASSLNLKLLPK